jgi:alkanesulfonate monooxygenase SsuD/methylene tetrahydromethanopterin reductase-like flavin-dependent oxidoreductase (luciferase family)
MESWRTSWRDSAERTEPEPLSRLFLLESRFFLSDPPQPNQLRDVSFGVYLPTYVGDPSPSRAGEAFLGVWDFPFLSAPSWENISKMALSAEELGYDSVWASDHFVFGKNGAAMECWTTLSALAPLTSSVAIGSLVLCNNYRNPALVAKMASTLAEVSSNRLILGYGAGWYGLEYGMFGYRFPPPGERVAMMTEGVRIIKGLLEEGRFSFSGRYYEILDAILEPKPKKRIPILIGGRGDRLLKTVAQLADAWDIGVNVAPANYRERVEALRGELRTEGRRFDEVARSIHIQVILGRDEDEVRRKKKVVSSIVERAEPRLKYKPSPDFKVDLDSALIGTPGKVSAKLKAYAELGCQRFILIFLDYPGKDALELFSSSFL